MAWNREEKLRAMTVLATHAGNAGLTAQVLKEQLGLNMKPAEIRRWRNSEFREDYERLVADMGDQTQAVINEVMETARLAAQAERLAIERTLHELQNGTCKDPARAARDLAHIKATNVEKFLTLSGRPSQIVEIQNPDEALQELVRMGVFKPALPGARGDDVIELPAAAVEEISATSGE